MTLPCSVPQRNANVERAAVVNDQVHNAKNRTQLDAVAGRNVPD